MVVPTPGGVKNPLVLAAAHLAGVTCAYAIGGAQAIAALAYGTATIPAVDKIVGPGNAYVAAAKRRVFGVVGIDMIAGPSEILIIADASANPDWVAMDFFAQAEHDEVAQAILLSPEAAVLDAVAASIARQLPALPRKDIIGASLSRRGALIRVREPGRGLRHRQPHCAGASRTCRRRPGAVAGAIAACRRDLPRPLQLRGDRRLLRRSESCPADCAQRAVFLAARRIRLSEAQQRDRTSRSRARRRSAARR